VTTYQNGFGALADPTRREIFERLARRPRPVGELAEGLPVSRPAVSQHLRVLSDAGLVISTRDGSRRLYRVDPKALAGMRSYLDRFWTDALAAFEDAARAEEDR
jgi:DNA-binding transcriptional ArsR family regulator